MRRIVTLLLTVMMVISVSVPSLADQALTNMSSEELAVLRDSINQELSSRESNASKFVIDTESYTIELTGIEEADKKGVNEYYDQYKPGTGSSYDGTCLILLFTFTNKIDEEASCSLSRDESSINGWMISAYAGIRAIGGKKKAKGFINAHLEDCEATNINEVQSFMFTFDVRQGDLKDKKAVSLVKTDNGWIFE